MKRAAKIIFFMHLVYSGAHGVHGEIRVYACRFGTDMFSLMSEDDLQCIFELQIPQVEAVDAKKRSLANTFATGGKKKVVEALAAIPKLPEPSPADQAEFVASMRSCMSNRTCSHEHACIARSASLLGCKFALLWHPEELQMDESSGQQCISHMHQTERMETGAPGTALRIPQLAAMWIVWILCNGGTVVASTASSAGGASSKGAKSDVTAVRDCPKQVTQDSAGACAVLTGHRASNDVLCSCS